MMMILSWFRAAAMYAAILTFQTPKSRNARLTRFTIDRLMASLSKFEQDIEVTVKVRQRRERGSDQMMRVL